MRDQILASPAALAAAFDELELNARLCLPTQSIFRARRVVLCGSGDSSFAAKAGEAAFWADAGLAAEARLPMEAGRYQSQLLSARDLENTLFIALSNSGGAARVIEAATLHRRAGATVLAVTANREGKLARMAEHRLLLPIPALPSAPGFGPYTFAVMALYLLAIRVAEVRMTITMDAAQHLRGRLRALVDQLSVVIADLDQPARDAAEEVAVRRVIEFVGAGPNLATAEFGAAKVLEASGRHALARDLEEWAHLNYFDAFAEELATVAVVPAASVAQGRAVELLNYWETLGRRVLIVGGGEVADAAQRRGHRVLSVPECAEHWSPLLTSAALALVAAHLAERDGAVYGRGSAGRWSDSRSGGTVQDSAIWEDRR